MKKILEFLRDCVCCFGDAFDLEVWEQVIQEREKENRG